MTDANHLFWTPVLHVHPSCFPSAACVHPPTNHLTASNITVSGLSRVTATINYQDTHHLQPFCCCTVLGTLVLQSRPSGPSATSQSGPRTLERRA